MSYAQLIVNPAAGGGKSIKRWPRIKELLHNTGLKFEYNMTEARGHAIELASSAARKGCKLIVSVGGDGTISEVVNGLYNAGSLKDVMLGIINTGTGSDYARTIGISRDYGEACRRLIEPRTRTVDLGILECSSNGKKIKRLFINFAGIGFATEVVKATTQSYKAMGSTASYLMGLLSTVIFYKNQEMIIVADGETDKRKVVTVLMCHGKYVGGGMMATPDADPHDGLFDVLIVDNMTKPDLLYSLPKIYNGTHLNHPKVTLKRAKELEIHPKFNMYIQADGDLVGEAPARFQVLSAALKVVV